MNLFPELSNSYNAGHCLARSAAFVMLGVDVPMQNGLEQLRTIQT